MGGGEGSDQTAKNWQSSWVDGITAELLKGVNEECIRALAQVFATCFEREEIPEEWARGLIVPIPKNQEVKKIENYRGITLLSIVGKAFVAILNERLTRWMEKRSVVAEEQAGFGRDTHRSTRCMCYRKLSRGRNKERNRISAHSSI